MTTLSYEEARRVYDRIGSFQDSQAFYEDGAKDLLLQHGGFESAQSVFEFGCGTGRFAQKLLSERLPENATYRGVDISPRMVELAQRRLEPYAARAEVILTEGAPTVDEPTGSVDRFVSSYVFDLLSEDDTGAVLLEAHQMLRPAGLLCLVSLSTGVGPFSRWVSSGWSWLQAHRPSLVGGCRPIDLRPRLSAADWDVRFHDKVVAFGITSEVVVAQRR